MGSISVSIHPLFFVFGFYYSLTGRIFVFVLYTFCAVVHELGHSFVAENLGYKLNKLTLLPFGAVAKGNVDGLRAKDEIKIALAGPFVNLAIGLFFVATWWVFPEFYAFTDTVVEANFSLAIVNFIPAYPLDGGRVMHAVLCQALGEKKATNICKIFGISLSLILLALFILTIFYSVNFSLLLFAIFVFAGTLETKKQNQYVKILCSVTDEKLKRGMPFKVFAVDKNTTVKQLMKILDPNAINEIVIYDKKEKVGKITNEKLNNILKNAEIYSPIGDYYSSK